jgi:hypothetical protein
VNSVYKRQVNVYWSYCTNYDFNCNISIRNNTFMVTFDFFIKDNRTDVSHETN